MTVLLASTKVQVITALTLIFVGTFFFLAVILKKYILIHAFFMVVDIEFVNWSLSLSPSVH